jgi:regulator of PEP synthase PpsR (kinase-PPPase family)
MYCLPFEYCLAWMLGVNSANVKEEIREKLLDYQRDCVEVLKRHFIGNMQKQAEINQLEIKPLERINELTENKNRINFELKDEKDRLQKIRNERLNNEPTLF